MGLHNKHDQGAHRAAITGAQQNQGWGGQTSNYTPMEGSDDPSWGDGMKADWTMLQEFAGFLKNIRYEHRITRMAQTIAILEFTSVSPIKVDRDYDFDNEEFEFRVTYASDKPPSPNSGMGWFIERCSEVMKLPPDPNQIKAALHNQMFVSFFQFAKQMDVRLGNYTSPFLWVWLLSMITSRNLMR